MTVALEGGEWSAARPGRTLPPGKTRYPFYRRLGGPQGRSGRAKNLVPTGIRFRIVQPVVSRYTDWATRPIMWCVMQYKCHNTQGNVCTSSLFPSQTHELCSTLLLENGSKWRSQPLKYEFVILLQRLKTNFKQRLFPYRKYQVKLKVKERNIFPFRTYSNLCRWWTTWHGLKNSWFYLVKCCYRCYLEANSFAGCIPIIHARYLVVEATRWMSGEGGVENCAWVFGRNVK